jgi:hypothetical protein
MNDLPGDGAEPTPSEVVETETVASNSSPPIEPTVVDVIDDTPSPPSVSTASGRRRRAALVAAFDVRPAKRSLWSTRVSLLLVAALVGGLAGHYASTSNSGPGGVTIDAVTNKPGAGYLPGWIEYSEIDQ